MNLIGVPEALSKLIFKHYNRLQEQKEVCRNQTILVLCHEKSIGTPTNFLIAKQYYTWAAEQGYAPAQYKLATYMLTNSQEQIELYRLAAIQEYAPTEANLALYHQGGNDGKENLEEVVRLYQLSAEQENARAQYYLGNCYWIGKDLPKNSEKAVQFYKLATERGEAMAQYSLGYLALQKILEKRYGFVN